MTALPAITRLQAREILDSRGNPTLEVDIWLADNSSGRASVPSGASTGSHETRELRDEDTKRYEGKGELKEVAVVRGEIAAAISGKPWTQNVLDQALIALDGTPNQSRLGGNAILAVSLAFAHAAAVARQEPLYRYFASIGETGLPLRLPLPLFNVLNGGRHATGSTDLQEFLLIPVGAPSFHEALRYGAETYHALRKVLIARGLPTGVGDEGGFAPPVANNEAALQLLTEAIERAGFHPGQDIALGMDVAASELWQNGSYHLELEKRTLDRSELLALYRDWVGRYPIVSLEDIYAEDDWEGWQMATRELGRQVQLIGDDLFATQESRLAEGVSRGAANAVLLKLNQVGTVSGAIQTARAAERAKYGAIISHRSGETEDTSIADLAVGLGVGQIKTGAPCHGERTAKYNQLLRIEEELGPSAPYAGQQALAREV
ncbi:MAG: phosphopyruvate hydratase [Candidatus Liptonbacteria bacterium]|nr:phosphopyruvate hydratase [Candidatus Liptonbacteria bacterium]